MKPSPISWLLRTGHRALQRLVPPKRTRICYLSLPDGSDNAYYMFRHLLATRSGLDHVWLLMDASRAVQVREMFSRLILEHGDGNHRLFIARRYSLTGYWLYLTSRCVFHTHGVYHFTNSAHRRHVVCLWHGMPIKCIGALNRISPNKYRTFATAHVANSPFFRYIIARAFEVAVDRVYVSGLPRVDALRFDDVVEHSRDQVRSALGVPAGDRLILWLPTYRSEGSRAPARSFVDDIDPLLLESLGQRSADNRCTVVVKLHLKDRLNARDKTTSLGSIRLLGAAHWLQLGIQLYDVLAASDALITDVSSVLIDYLATDRPIGVLGFDPDTYTRELTFPMSLLLRSPRVSKLASAEQIGTFVTTVAAGRPVAVPENDLSRALHAEPAEKSAEWLARAVGI